MLLLSHYKPLYTKQLLLTKFHHSSRNNGAVRALALIGYFFSAEYDIHLILIQDIHLILKS